MTSRAKRTRSAKKDMIFPSASSNSRSSRQREAKSKDTLRLAPSKRLPDCEVIEISSDEGDDTPKPNQPGLIADLHKQIAQLKDENSKLQHDLEEKHSSPNGKILLDATEIEDNVSCEICAMKMWSPYLLPDCGHTFCQSCLQNWFATALSKFTADHPGYDQSQANDVARLRAMPTNRLNGHWPHWPQYSCPACRKTVHSKPVEVYTLKALVRVVASAAGEKSPQKASRKRNNDGPPASLWDRFFPT